MDSAYVARLTIWRCLGLRAPFKLRCRPAHNRERRFLLTPSGDCANELVSSARNINDEPISVLSVAQRAAQSRNMDGQICRTDKDIWPNAVGQFLLADKLTCALNQSNQDFQCTTSQRHWLVAFQQQKLCRKQAKRPE